MEKRHIYRPSYGKRPKRKERNESLIADEREEKLAS